MVVTTHTHTTHKRTHAHTKRQKPVTENARWWWCEGRRPFYGEDPIVLVRSTTFYSAKRKPPSIPTPPPLTAFQSPPSLCKPLRPVIEPFRSLEECLHRVRGCAACAPRRHSMPAPNPSQKRVQHACVKTVGRAMLARTCDGGVQQQRLRRAPCGG